MITLLAIPFCFGFGVYAFRNPEKVWEYQHFLTVKDGTPTAYSLFMIKTCGIIFILMGILMSFFWIDIILHCAGFK